MSGYCYVYGYVSTAHVSIHIVLFISRRSYVPYFTWKLLRKVYRKVLQYLYIVACCCRCFRPSILRTRGNNPSWHGKRRAETQASWNIINNRYVHVSGNLGLNPSWVFLSPVVFDLIATSLFIVSLMRFQSYVY